MTIDRKTLIFFDASCLVAASGSATGGSAFLLGMCSRGLLQGVVSQPVLLEAERNVIEQLRPQALSAFHRLIATTPLAVVPLPPRSARVAHRNAVGEKDEHVLAAAIESGARFFLPSTNHLSGG